MPVPCNFGRTEDDTEVVLDTILALKEEWPIPLSTFFMKYSARNGEKTLSPNRSPMTPGKITLKIKNRVKTPFSVPLAFDGTPIKVEETPLLLLRQQAATDEKTNYSAVDETAVVVGVDEDLLLEKNITVASGSSSSSAVSSTPLALKKQRVSKQ